MIKTRVIIVEQSHTHIVRKKREKHFMTRAIVKLAALLSTIVKPSIRLSSGKTRHQQQQQEACW